MAATGSRRWKGMDVQVLQETCGVYVDSVCSVGERHSKVGC